MAAHTVLAAVRGSVKTPIYDSVLTFKKCRPLLNGDTMKSKCARVTFSLVFAFHAICLVVLAFKLCVFLSLNLLLCMYFCSIVLKVTLFGGNTLLHPTPPGSQQQSLVLHPMTPLDTTTASFAAASWGKMLSRGLSLSNWRSSSTYWATTVTASTYLKRIDRTKTYILRQLKTKALSLQQRSNNDYTSQ